MILNIKKFNNLIVIIFILQLIKLNASAQEFISLYQNLELLSKLLNSIEKKGELQETPVSDGSGKAEPKKQPILSEIKSISNAKNIGPELDKILQNPTQQKEALLNFLKVLHNFILSNKYNEKDKKLIQDAISRIFESQTKKTKSIDPMIIASSISILKDINVPQEDLNKLMTSLYTDQISFLTTEFGKIKGSAAYKGLREDVLDAMCYPMAIFSQIQEADLRNRIKGIKANENDPDAKFVNEINTLKEKLSDLLKKNQTSLKDLKVDSFISMLETQPKRFCQRGIHIGCGPYTTVFQDIDAVLKTIDNYEKHEEIIKKCEQIFDKQQIVNKLNSLYIYLTQGSCQNCLDTDFYNNITADNPEKVSAKDLKATALSDTLNRINRDFDIINKFFQDLPADSRNIKLVEDLRKIFINRTMERDRLGLPR